MSSRYSLIASTIASIVVVAAAGLILLLAETTQAATVELRVAAVERSAGDGFEGAVIQETDRISIPYGFRDSLALMDDGDSVVATGRGACTAGETITIAFTVTQSTGARATGLWDGACTGALQSWTQTSSTIPSPSLSAGAATACAVAETRADGTVTDSQDWCNDVLLATHTIFLPSVRKE